MGLATQLDHCAGGGPHHAGLALRELLRSATRDVHGRLDVHAARLDLQLLGDYRRFLEATAAALLPLESALVKANVKEQFPDWGRRTRGRAILSDLHAVSGRIPPVAALARFGREDVLGTMYVLEGSRLGSRALLRVVSASPDSIVASATAYLGQGAGLPLWPTFLSMLQRGAAHNDHDKLIAAARRAFGLFEMSFSAIDC